MEITNCTFKKPKHRNESHDPSSSHGWRWLLWLAGAVIIALTGVVTYAYFGHQRKSLNREVLMLESAQIALSDDLKRERYRWSTLKSPANLERTLAGYGIPMQIPHERQIVYIEAHHMSGVGVAQNR